MKIVLEEKDKNYIDKINKDLQDGDTDIPLYINANTSKVFFEFEIKDTAKANALALFLMDYRSTDMLSNVCGVEVKSITYNHEIIKDNIKRVLQEAIDKIDEM